ncbi:MAG: hypothetical protein NUV91_06115 [Candidatus Omnitrophica bacterium]|nr:hypothetical protein [Candidatus Omnitrophota bacterium]
MKHFIPFLILTWFFGITGMALSQEKALETLTPPTNSMEVEDPDELSEATIFDDKLLIQGYSEKYQEEPQNVIIEMIKDDSLNPLKMSAAIRVFREQYSQKLFSRDKILMEKTLLRRLSRTESPFVQVEAIYTLAMMNRYRYFKPMIPALILKLDHYNSMVNELAYEYLNKTLENGNTRVREARIVFTTLRRMLFLSRKRLAETKEPDARLQQKIKLVRWAIKTLGTQEIRRLPPEVIHLF